MTYNFNAYYDRNFCNKKKLSYCGVVKSRQDKIRKRRTVQVSQSNSSLWDVDRLNKSTNWVRYLESGWITNQRFPLQRKRTIFEVQDTRIFPN